MKNKIINLFDNNKVIQNKGVKYSVLLEQFLKPFANEFKDVEYIEDIFEFAINAWNFGNMKAIIPQDEFKNTTQFIQDQENDINSKLLLKMIDYKVANFKNHTNFIVDYELKETNNEPVLSITTQSEDAHLSNMITTLDNEITPDDFEENYINRNAIIIKPLQPFIDWHNNLYPNNTIDQTDIEVDLYLVNSEIDDLEKWLKKKFDKFFMLELENWHTDKKEWPQKRNYKMFKQWFEVQTSDLIYDLEKKPVLKSE